MTDQTQPEIPGAEAAVTPPKTKAAWFLVDGEPVKADVAGREDETSYPTKKAAAEAAAASAAPAPTKADGSTYLPTLPKGYAYTQLGITGPSGESLLVEVGVDGVELTVVADIERTTPYPSFTAAVKAAGERAKLLVKRAARKAELAALDAEFGED